MGVYGYIRPDGIIYFMQLNQKYFRFNYKIKKIINGSYFVILDFSIIYCSKQLR